MVNSVEEPSEAMEERLQKVLAQAGVASRREAEKYITAGRVQVNGKVVRELGTRVVPADVVQVDGKRIRRERPGYYLFYKPRGVVTTMSDPEGRRCIADFAAELPQHVFPVGRLDYNTEGLLLLTNDGALAQALMHPSHEVNKTYRATVLGIVPDAALDQLRMGVQLEDGLTAPAVVTLGTYDHEHGLTTFDIVIHEGRNRQVRRMCDAVGHPVRELTRTKLGNLTLSGVTRGHMRELELPELNKLRALAGLEPVQVPTGRAPGHTRPGTQGMRTAAAGGDKTGRMDRTGTEKGAPDARGTAGGRKARNQGRQQALKKTKYQEEKERVMKLYQAEEVRVMGRHKTGKAGKSGKSGKPGNAGNRAAQGKRVH